MSELNGFDDGYTHPFSYDAIPGLRGGNSGTFRPMSLIERDAMSYHLSTAKGEKFGEAVAKVVAGKVKSWSLTMAEKDTPRQIPIPLTEESCKSRVHPSHVDMMFNIVMGFAPSNPPSASPSVSMAGQGVIESLLGTAPTGEQLKGN